MIYHEGDTIAAIATAPGTGGIAVIRISGPEAHTIAARIFRPKHKAIEQYPPRTAIYGDIEAIDDVVLTLYTAPASFTGENVAEIACHGSLYIQRRIMQLLLAEGCRQAGPGEFTRRAFINGRIDLAEAEAVADLISARTEQQHRLALSQMHGSVSARLKELNARMLHAATLIELELDFSDHEDVEFADRRELLRLITETKQEVNRLLDSFAQGRAIREGITVAIIGRANTGKSTLMNRLVDDDCAIVSPIAGTTRDTVERTIALNGLMFRFIDTAGLRPTNDPIEQLGQERTRAAAAHAMIVISLSTPESAEIEFKPAEEQHIIHCVNKIDLCPAPVGRPDIIALSAKRGDNIDKLLSKLFKIAQPDEMNDVTITETRHYEALTLALADLERVTQGLNHGLPTDLVAEDLHQAINHLADITGGQITPQAVLNNIFSKFCIGK